MTSRPKTTSTAFNNTNNSNNMKENKTEVTRLTSKEKSLIQEVRAFSQSSSKPDGDYEANRVKLIYQLINKTDPQETTKPIFYEEGKSRVLVIGDIHCPFDLEEYLYHCQQMYLDFHCNQVVFIGDVIDNSYSSYHETDPDGYSAGEELLRAKDRLQRYYKAFPKATVILGNHDRLIKRKAFSGGVPKEWIKEFSEVLEVPGWDFVDHIVIDGVLYVHGEGGTARTRIKSEHQSTVQGHLHTQAYIEWIFNAQHRVFGMQVGTGIDFDAFAFAYAKRGKKPAVSCGVVLNGTQPFLIPMSL